MSAPNDSGSLRFGPFLFDPVTLELRREGRLVPLTERPARLLAVLLTRAGRVVSKEELLDAVWSDVIVTDDSLFHAVRELRNALGDGARDPVYVQTVHRRGYRFIAPVEHEPASPCPAEPAGASPEPPGRTAPAGKRRAAWPVAIGLVVALGALFLLPRSSRTRRSDPQLHEVVRWRHGLVKPVYSPRSELVAAVAPEPGTGVYSLFLIKPGLEKALQLSHGLDVRGPAPTFSPDGTRIYFTVYRSGAPPAVWQVPVLGAEPAPFLEGATAVTFEPGGRRFAYTGATPGGSELRVAGDGDEIVLARPAYWPRWSPDGRWIAWTTSDPEGGDGRLFVARPDGSERRCLSPRRTQHYGLSWTPDSSAIVLANDRSGTFDLWLYPLDGGPPKPLTVGVDTATSPTVRNDGRRIIFCRGSKLDGVVLLPGGEGPPEWVVHRDHVVRAALGRAGRVAVILERPSGRVLRVKDSQTGRWEDVGNGELGSVGFAPDGGLLVTVHEGATWVVERWGRRPGQRRVLYRERLEIDWPVLTADGSVLLFVRHAPDGDRLVERTLAGGGERILAAGPRIEAPRLSPDGRLVAYSGGYRPPSPGAAGVWVVPVDGTRPPRRIWPDGAWPSWQAGRQLIFARYFEAEGIWRIPLEGGNGPQRLRGPVEGLPLWYLDGDPSGNRLLAHLEVQSPTLWALDDPEL